MESIIEAPLGPKERQNHLYLVATEGGSGCVEEGQAHCISCIECIRSLVERVSPEILGAFDVRHCHVLSPAESGAHDNPAWLQECGSAFRHCMSRIKDLNRRIVILSSVEDAPYVANLITHAAQSKLLSHETGDTSGSVVIAVSPDEAPAERLKVLERAMRASKDRLNGRMSLLIGRRFIPLPGLQLQNGQLVSRFSDMGGVDKRSEELLFGQEMPEHFPQGADDESNQHFAAAPILQIPVANGDEDAINDITASRSMRQTSENQSQIIDKGFVFSLHTSARTFNSPQSNEAVSLANSHRLPSLIVNEGGGNSAVGNVELQYVVDGRPKGMNPLEAKIFLSHAIGVAEKVHGSDNPDEVMKYVRKRLEEYLS